jgi:transcriptional regulator with XRE-family HTH domain
MKTLKQYRIEARVSISEVARRAGISPVTVGRAEEGKTIQELKAILIADALSQLLGRTITIGDIEDLHVSR